MKRLCPKRLSERRWECLIESKQAIQLQFPGYPAAIAVAGITSDDNVKNEIISTGQQVAESEFDVSVI